MPSSKIIEKLKHIERSVLQKNYYIDKNDVHNLTLIDTNESLLKFDDEESLNLSLVGLKNLCHDILSILNEAYVAQQASIVQLKNESKSCQDFINLNLEQIKTANILHHNEQSLLETNLLGVHDVIPSINNDWNHLPPADDEVLIHNLSYIEHKKKIDLVMKMLRRRLVDSYHSLQDLIDVKVKVYNLIESIFDEYKYTMILESQIHGMANCAHKISVGTKPQFSLLLENRFLDTTEVNSFAMN